MQLPTLKPSQLRSRILANMYEGWKKDGIAHYSPSGMTAHYIMNRATEDGLSFALEYSAEFKGYKIQRIERVSA